MECSFSPVQYGSKKKRAGPGGGVGVTDLHPHDVGTGAWRRFGSVREGGGVTESCL